MKIPVDGDVEPLAQDQDLSDELAAYYRQMLAAHTADAETGTCPVCGVPRCPDWVSTYDVLAGAHQLMATSPPPWEPFRPRARSIPSSAPGLTRRA